MFLILACFTVTIQESLSSSLSFPILNLAVTLIVRTGKKPTLKADLYADDYKESNGIISGTKIPVGKTKVSFKAATGKTNDPENAGTANLKNIKVNAYSTVLNQLNLDFSVIYFSILIKNLNKVYDWCLSLLYRPI